MGSRWHRVSTHFMCNNFRFSKLIHKYDKYKSKKIGQSVKCSVSESYQNPLKQILADRLLRPACVYVCEGLLTAGDYET